MKFAADTGKGTANTKEALEELIARDPSFAAHQVYADLLSESGDAHRPFPTESNFRRQLVLVLARLASDRSRRRVIFVVK